MLNFQHDDSRIRTRAEIAAGVTPVNFAFEPGNVRRYGAKGDNVADDTAAIQAAVNVAIASGSYPSIVWFPNGVYKLTSPITATPQVMFLGEQLGAYSNTLQYTGGVWLNKAHNGRCIFISGSTPYSGPGSIRRITIYSDKATYSSSSGHGIEVDQVGSYVIEDVSVLTVGGDSFHLGGSTGGDVTGHVYLKNTYSNGAGARSYYVNAKWCRLFHPICDGGTYSLYVEGNGSELQVDSAHFEGATTGGVYIRDSADLKFTGKGFLGNTAGHAIGFEFVNVSGTQSAKIEGFHMVGSAAAGKTAVKISGSSNVGIEISSCNIVFWDLALDDAGDFTNFHHNTVYGGFGTTAKSIKINGATRPHYHHNYLTGTTSANCIEHVSGASPGGQIVDNELDSPILATATGVAGDFGNMFVDRNRGFATSAYGVTGTIASGTAVSHGLANTPSFIATQQLSGTYSNFVISAATSTTFTASWAGGVNVQYYWQAKLKCAIQL